MENTAEKIETEGFYAREYGLNVDVPKGMTDADFKDYTYHLNRGLIQDERIKYYKKPISWEEGQLIAKRSRENPEEESLLSELWEGGKNILKTGWNQTVDLATSFGEATDVGVSSAVLSAMPNQEKARQVLLNQIEAYNEVKDKIKLDTSTAGEVSSGLGSVGLSTFAGAATYGHPVLNSMFLTSFGLSNYLSNLETMLKEGASIKEANIRALTGGVAEVASEKAGLKIAGKYTNSLFKKYNARFGIEGIQELWQDTKDEVVLGKYDTRTEEEKAKSSAYALLFGGLGGAIGFAVADISTRTPRKNIEKKANEVGYTKEEAKQIGLSVLDEDGAEQRKEIQAKATERAKEQIKETRSQLYDKFIESGDSAEIASEKAQMLVPDYEVIKKDVEEIVREGFGEDEKENLKKAYIEATSNASEDADKYILMKDEIKSLIEKAGKDEQEADETARIMTSIAINSYQIAKEQGVDVDFDKIKNEVFKLNNIINYAQNEPISEAEQEDIWKEVERERVAKLQEGIDRYMDVKMYSFAGENAKLPKAQKTSLDEAKSLEGGLLSAEEIRQTTGWFRGDDNKWRLEISDRDATINVENLKEGKLKLKDILTHDKLFRAYPQLKDEEVIYSPKLSVKAQVERTPLGARMNIGELFLKESEAEKRKTIMHEVQHFIQGYEKFARGGSKSEFRSSKMDLSQIMKHNRRVDIALEILGLKGNRVDLDEARTTANMLLKNGDSESDLVKKAAELKKLDEALADFDKNTALGKYRRLGGEIESRNVVARIDLTDEERRAISPEKTRDVPREDAIVRFRDGSEYVYNQEQSVEEEGKLYSKAYVSTRFPLVGEYFDADRFEGIGEGSSVHGWGNYALKDRITNKTNYYDFFSQVKGWYKGEPIDYESKLAERYVLRELTYASTKEIAKENLETRRKIAEEDLKRSEKQIENLRERYNLTNEDIKNLEELQEADNSAFSAFGDLSISVRQRAYDRTKELEKVIPSKALENKYVFFLSFDQRNSDRRKLNGYTEALEYNLDDFEVERTGAQYEVDVPEDEFLLDEQKDFDEQSEYVKERLVEVMEGLRQPNFKEKIFENKEEGYDFFDKKLEEYKSKGDGFERFHPKEFTTENGEYGVKYVDDYTVIENFLENGNILGGGIYDRIVKIVGSKKQASQLLELYGIKGIKYDGRIDGVGYVIFNGKDMPVKRRLLSQTEGEALGSYDIAKREVELFKGHNPSTLTHELGHHFIISHLNFMESIGANDKNKPVFEFLSSLANREINSVRDMKRADHENLVEAFIDYMNIGQAPNIVTGNIFQRAKNWLINEYNIHKTTASKEIREYFDSLISRESSIPEMGKIQDRIGEFKEILKQAQQGEQVFFNGLGKQEVKDLKKAINTRIRRKGMSLRDELIKSGGIKEGTELAKALGFDVLKKDKIFSTKATAIESEQELIDWLADKGYIVGVQEGESYSDTSNRWNEVENLIYNAETVYKPEEQRINEERESGLANQAKAQEIVDEILKDNTLGLKSIGDLDDLLSKITSRKDDVDIVKMNKSALQYLDVKLNELTKEYNNVINKANQQARQIGKELVKVNEELKNLKEDTEVSKRVKELAQEQYIDFIKNQHLSGDNKVKMLSKVDEINSFNDLVRVVRRVVPQIQRLIEMEKKHIQKRNIDIILGKTKPKKRTKQFSTYTYNTLFEELRDINRLSKKGAEAKISKIMSEMEKRELEGKETFTWQDVIKNKMLHYKSLGMEASSQLMESLHNDLLELYMEANQKGFEAKIEKQERRAEMIKEVVDYVDTHEASKNFISRLFNHKEKSDDLYIKNTNFYGISNALFGKKWADEHEMVTVLNQVQKDTYARYDRMIKAAKTIYKTNSRSKLQDIFADKNDTSKYILKSNDGAVYDISTMQIMDFYIGMKNTKTKKQLLRNYEVFDEEGNQITNQLEDLFGNLTQEDIEFADWLQKDLEKNYEKLNELYIKMYGIDMPQEENYFPRTSERSDILYELEDLKVYTPVKTISGMMKDRASFVKPIAKNVLDKYNRNIADYYYMIDAFGSFKDIYDVVSSSNVKAIVNNKYSEKTYKALMDNIRAMSLNGQQTHLSDLDGKFNRLVSNVIGSKIAINPDVAIKQFVSFTNYIENMPVDDFLKYQAEFWANPKKAIEFMEEFDKPFFEARKNAGLQTEAIARMTRDMEQTKNRDFLAETIGIKGLTIKAGWLYNWNKWMGSAVKYGDIWSIYAGGYARVKYLLDSGMSVDEARKVFEKETLQSQQDSSAASLASFQRSKHGVARLFTAFLNAPAQYQRKMFDADIQWRRGEISDMQFFKTITNYGVIQPMLFAFITNLLRKFWSGDDEEETLFDGIASQVLTSPFQGIPFWGNALTSISSSLEKKITSGEGSRYDIVSVLLSDDINKAYHKLGKKEKGVLDWLDVATPALESLVIAPTNTIKKFIKLGKRLADE